MKTSFYILFILLSALSSAQLLPIQQGEKWGFITLQGNEIISPTYQWVSGFRGHYCIVKSDENYGVINQLGESIIDTKHRNITFYTEGLLSITNLDRKKKLYHLSSKREWENSFSAIYFISDSTYAVTNENQQFGLCNGFGEEIITLKYDTITKDSHFLLGIKDSTITDYYTFSGKFVFANVDYYEEWNSSDTLIVLKHEKINLYSTKDEQLLLPNWSNEVAPLFNPLLSVAKNGLWGVYNLKSNSFVIPQQFTQISFPNQEYIIGKMDNSNHLYTVDGKLVYSSSDDILFINDNLLLTTSDNKQFTFQYLPTKSTGTTIQSARIATQKNGLIIIQKKKKKGVVNKKGQLLVPAQYDKIYCDNEQIKVIKDDQLIIFTLSDEQTINNQQLYTNYRSIQLKETPYNFLKLRNIVSRPRQNKMASNTITSRFSAIPFVINPVKELKLPQTQKVITIYKQVYKGETTYGLATVDKSRHQKKLTKADYWHIDLGDYNKGDYAKAILQGGRNCLIHYTGKLIYKGKVRLHGEYSTKPFAFIGDFNDGLAPVNIDGALYPDQRWSQLRIKLTIDRVKIIQGVWGFYNRNGDQIVKANFRKVTNFDNGRAFVLSKGWGMISTKGDTVVEPIYHSLKYLDKTKNLIIAGKKKQLYGIASPNGTILSPTSYSKIRDYAEGYFQVQKNKLWGYLNAVGDEKIACKYTKSRPFGKDHLAAVKTKYLWGFIDTLGNWVIEPAYINAQSFEKGTAVVKNKKGYGVINLKGQWLIPAKYKKIIRAGDGLYWIKKGQKYGLVNASGKWILSPQFEVVYPFDKKGIARVRSLGTFQAEENSTGLVNREGKIILKTKYRPTVSYISDSLLVFQEQLGILNLNYLKGLVNIHGEIVVKPNFTRLFLSSKNTIAMRSKGEFSIYQISPFKLLFKCSDIKPGKSEFLIYKQKTKKGWLVKKEDGSLEYHLQKTSYIYGSTSDNKLIMKSNGQYKLFDLYSRRFDVIEINKIIANYHHHLVIKFHEEGFVKLIDDKQHLLIDGNYNHIKKMKSGYYLLGQSWHYGIFDRDGYEITPCQADQIKYLDELDLVQVRIGKTLKYLDINGNWIH